MEEIFKTQPHLTAVYVTADGECFYKADDAKNYAKTLAVKTVERVENPAMIKVALEIENNLEVDEAEEEAVEKAELKATKTTTKK